MNHQSNPAREALPFTIELVTDAASLGAAVQIRHSAYARHLPDVAKNMVDADSWDFKDGTVVLVAKSKLDGAPIGTMRIHTNEFASLPLEQSYELPKELTQLRLAEATRLGVTAERVGQVVTTALFKAYYLYCLETKIDVMVIAARRPVDRLYERILFKDVNPTDGYVPMAHVNGLPHRVLHFHVAQAHSLWQETKHPFGRFLFETEHPDIMVTPSCARLQAASNEAVLAVRA